MISLQSKDSQESSPALQFKSINSLALSPLCFPCGSAGKESACSAGDLGSIPGLGRSPGEGNCYSLQYSGLENSMDCIVYGIAKSWTRLRNFYFQPGHSHQPHSCLTHPFHQDFLLGGGDWKMRPDRINAHWSLPRESISPRPCKGDSL